MKEEKFELNSQSPGITEQDGSGILWKDIWDFKVPINQSIVLKPTDLFSAYLVGDDVAEMPNVTRIRVARRDVANEDAKSVLGEVYYKLAKEFTDKNLLMHLSIDQPVEIGAEEHIVVQVSGLDATGTGDTDASASFFKILTPRKRKSI